MSKKDYSTRFKLGQLFFSPISRNTWVIVNTYFREHGNSYKLVLCNSERMQVMDEISGIKLKGMIKNKELEMI